ncbi:MAG: Uma2 family endonuclease [Sporomusaceae bacterium]|jgi:Uma2 family endonuclease|nr:Uma2 family endonuclease [Sporomusaceae bacterium]
MGNLAYQNEMDEVWEEMLDGKIVAMSPRPLMNHSIVAGNIRCILGNYLRNKPYMVFGNLDVYLTEKDRVIPDAMIVCNRDIIKQSGIHGAPDLIVEVLSPSTAKKDKGYKKKLYEKCGVKEYWLVDTDSHSIEVYLLQGGIFELDEVCAIFPDDLIEKMTEAEKNSIIYEFTTSLFPEMKIILKDVFENIL